MSLQKPQLGGASFHNSPGIVIAFPAWWYDLLVRWVVMSGKEHTFRQMAADVAQLQPGETVLDVGCGTGTQALVAKKRVGELGQVCGIDPSLSLLAGARRKATRAGLSIDFQPGGIEQIPFPDQVFDVVLSTFVMHHVPDNLKHQGLTEIARVLKPGGRLLMIDFKHSEEHQNRSEPFGEGEIGLQDLPALLKQAGFSQRETGEIPFRIRSVSSAHKHYGFVKARRS
ncbi:hypothetical protein KSD_95490 [Ktedonobacter sp. SOSP1-85]|uniref:class I SAM-dependent methyltransferase n=1 Tax=Ktedonobacter sp. SOSP1-85 TaxID=2778367 RepID=UPI00191637EA|nr:methyltransferase domain-containing protein [Ktedonobacter sp. SOSP1-85]GHO81778.1 hypothetical protein KSD_95490 [Ktedonobacter sp. SOSP1-85]